MNFKGSPFEIVGVAIDDDPFEMQAFQSKYQLPFPIVMDTAGELKEFFQIKELPSTLFLNKQGVPIRFQDPSTGETTAKLSGPRAWDTARPVEMIAALVEGH